MAAKKRGPAANRSARERLLKNLRRYIRTQGKRFLDDPNITSVGVGYKVTRGRRTRQISLQFTVGSKVENTGTALEAVKTTAIPTEIQVAGQGVPTDVLERDYKIAHQAVTAEELDRRKQRLDPLVPGVSVSHRDGSAGTIGLIVYDRQSGDPCILSNWHVLHRASGKIGDPVVQPGPHDDNDVARNRAGSLLRSHLGDAGDCAIARIEGRQFAQEIYELDVEPTTIVRVELGDRVIKSGRTTGVTRGLVRRVDVIARIDYPGTGPTDIGGFEYGPEEDAPAGFEVSLGGDSGSAVLIARPNGEPTTMLAGLHFAGETSDNPDEHGIACYAHSVFKKLDISLEPISASEIEAAGRGYDEYFLAERVRVPWLSNADYGDAVKLDGSHLIPYTHFSVCLSREQGLARFVAWNVDGARIRSLSRKGIGFRLDPRVDSDFQHGNELYKNNPLDRGHIARRASLCWGSESEAKRANQDSFFYTNIAPQHEAFNQSKLSGLWGELENAIFAEVKVLDLRISTMGGPIFRKSDPMHRGVGIPREFWKLVAYTDEDDGEFKVRAFILSQRDLVAGIEALDLGEFRMFQVTLDALGEATGMDFSRLSEFDTLPEAIGVESVRRRVRAVREVARQEDLRL